MVEQIFALYLPYRQGMDCPRIHRIEGWLGPSVTPDVLPAGFFCFFKGI
jgi:hypothetical protein